MLLLRVERGVEMLDTVKHARFAQVLQFPERIFFQNILPEPGLYGRSAYRDVHHTHGNTCLFLQIPCGKVADSAPGQAGLFTVQDLPGACGKIITGAVKGIRDGDAQITDGRV